MALTRSGVGICLLAFAVGRLIYPRLPIEVREIWFGGVILAGLLTGLVLIFPFFASVGVELYASQRFGRFGQTPGRLGVYVLAGCFGLAFAGVSAAPLAVVLLGTVGLALLLVPWVGTNR
jgi:O-antigen/teichoic acid export membrane protein